MYKRPEDSRTKRCRLPDIVVVSTVIFLKFFDAKVIIKIQQFKDRLRMKSNQGGGPLRNGIRGNNTPFKSSAGAGTVPVAGR